MEINTEYKAKRASPGQVRPVFLSLRQFHLLSGEKLNYRLLLRAPQRNHLPNLSLPKGGQDYG